MSAPLFRPVAMLLLLGSACSSAPPAPVAVRPHQPLPVRESVVDTHLDGVPGGSVANKQLIEATIAGIDNDQRRFVLLDDLGNRHELAAPAGMASFSRLKVGDRVMAQLTSETIVQLASQGQALPTGSGSASLLLAPEQGRQSGVVALEKRKRTATVLAVDLASHTATLQFENGQRRTVPVRPDVNLSSSQVGQEVVIITSTTLVVTVTSQ